uniref:Uncharacterized protein n=1 Tax=Hyaloperonospora arabidopsidis (strain Emoy2) TaxID=559515 RepID=M4B9K4_HYAAE
MGRPTHRTIRTCYTAQRGSWRFARSTCSDLSSPLSALPSWQPSSSRCRHPACQSISAQDRNLRGQAAHHRVPLHQKKQQTSFRLLC